MSTNIRAAINSSQALITVGTVSPVETTEKRVNAGLTVLPSVLERIDSQAGVEHKSRSRLIEDIMTWALDQIIDNRINSITLREWTAVPPSHIAAFEKLKEEVKAEVLPKLRERAEQRLAELGGSANAKSSKTGQK